MAEPDDVGAVLGEPGREGEALGVEDQRDVSGIPIGIIAHQDRELAARFQRPGTVTDELAVSPQEMLERR